MDFMAVYQEGGMVALVGIIFVYLVISMSKKSEAQQIALEDLKIENRGQSESLESIQSMVIKLIDRWNKSDDISLRHRQDMIEALGDVEKQLSRMDGIMSRMNGNSK
tara:strand:- start:16 stop:336 length:321 start_codon:yes stop_codon:yes gene_type:complete